jgi:hypothetical protein
MNDLDSRARAIVEAARDADDPSPADRNRIRHAVLVQLAAGAVASTAVAGTMTVGMKLGLAALAVSLVGGGAAGIVQMRRPQSTTSAAVHARVPVVSRTTASPVAIPEAAMPPAIAAPSVESQARRPDKPRKAVAQNIREGEEDQLNAEVAVLKRAREDLRLGRPAQALEALREYDRRFGKGTLGEERQAMAAIAACQAHPGPSARAQAQAFMLASPHSPLLDRVRVTCITPARENSP